MNKFCFLIGAHKTGSTYLSKKLLLNQNLLKDNGIRFETTGTVSPNLSRLLNDSEADADVMRRIRNFIYEKEDEYERVAFAHENISGIVASFFSYGRLYPRIGKRVELLFQVMEGMPVDIMFSIRSYDSFILSFYSENIREYGFVTFEEFEQRVVKPDLSWVRVLEDIYNAYPGANLKIYDYSLLTDNEQLITDSIIARTGLRLEEAEVKIARPSISQKGLDVLHLLIRLGFTELSPKLINFVAEILPKSKSLGRLNPWTDPESPSRLRELYADHKAQIAGKFDTL